MVLSYLQQMRQKNSSFASMRVCTRGHHFSLQNSPKSREPKKKSKEKFTHSDRYRYNMPRAHTERQKQVTLRTIKTFLSFCLQAVVDLNNSLLYCEREREKKKREQSTSAFAKLYRSKQACCAYRRNCRFYSGHKLHSEPTKAEARSKTGG